MTRRDADDENEAPCFGDDALKMITPVVRKAGIVRVYWGSRGAGSDFQEQKREQKRELQTRRAGSDFQEQNLEQKRELQTRRVGSDELAQSAF